MNCKKLCIMFMSIALGWGVCAAVVKAFVLWPPREQMSKWSDTSITLIGPYIAAVFVAAMIASAAFILPLYYSQRLTRITTSEIVISAGIALLSTSALWLPHNFGHRSLVLLGTTLVLPLATSILFAFRRGNLR